MCCPICGVEIICRFVDFHQFPPMALKGIHGVSSTTYTDSSEFYCRIYFQSFINVSPDDDKYHLVVIIDKVVRHTYPSFQSCLENTKQVTVAENYMAFLTSRMEINIVFDDSSHFNNAFNIMPQWRLIVNVIDILD